MKIRLNFLVLSILFICISCNKEENSISNVDNLELQAEQPNSRLVSVDFDPNSPTNQYTDSKISLRGADPNGDGDGDEFCGVDDQSCCLVSIDMCQPSAVPGGYRIAWTHSWCLGEWSTWSNNPLPNPYSFIYRANFFEILPDGTKKELDGIAQSECTTLYTETCEPYVLVSPDDCFGPSNVFAPGSTHIFKVEYRLRVFEEEDCPFTATTQCGNGSKTVTVTFPS